jgi:NhaP-type Na+/H+ or K+/H+ antiporter
MLGLGIFAAVVAVYGLVAAQLGRMGVTRPIAYTAAGVVVGVAGVEQPLAEGRPAGLVLAVGEIALTLVLFADASRITLSGLRHGTTLPLRLLGPGMLLSVGLGTLAGLWLFGALDVWQCAVLAAILAPTDAALGAVVVRDRRVPGRIRQALNVEAGLNDGLAVPFLLLFIAGVEVKEGLAPGSFFATTLLEKIGIGVVVGIALGAAAGYAARRTREDGWSTRGSEQLALAGAAVAIFVFCEELGGSGFIAAYVGGLAAGNLLRSERGPAMVFTDREGAIVSSFVFFLLGLIAVELVGELTWRSVAYAVLTLTVVRMVSVGVALAGSGFGRPTVAFVGWFGPRGLASIVLALVALEELGASPATDLIVLTALMTVVLSVVAHGVSASPLADRYARWAGTLPAAAPELGETTELPARPGLNGRPPVNGDR